MIELVSVDSNNVDSNPSRYDYEEVNQDNSMSSRDEELFYDEPEPSPATDEATVATEERCSGLDVHQERFLCNLIGLLILLAVYFSVGGSGKEGSWNLFGPITPGNPPSMAPYHLSDDELDSFVSRRPTPSPRPTEPPQTFEICPPPTAINVSDNKNNTVANGGHQQLFQTIYHSKLADDDWLRHKYNGVEKVYMSGDASMLAFAGPFADEKRCGKECVHSKGEVFTYAWSCEHGEYQRWGQELKGYSKDMRLGLIIAMDDRGFRMAVGSNDQYDIYERHAGGWEATGFIRDAARHLHKRNYGVSFSPDGSWLATLLRNPERNSFDLRLFAFPPAGDSQIPTSVSEITESIMHQPDSLPEYQKRFGGSKMAPKVSIQSRQNGMIARVMVATYLTGVTLLECTLNHGCNVLKAIDVFNASSFSSAFYCSPQLSVSVSVESQSALYCANMENGDYKGCQVHPQECSLIRLEKTDLSPDIVWTYGGPLFYFELQLTQQGNAAVLQDVQGRSPFDSALEIQLAFPRRYVEYYCLCRFRMFVALF